MSRLVIVFALALTACPPSQPPGPVPPDATDGAVPTPGTPCESACAAMARFCGPQRSDCEQTMAHIDGSKAKRNDKTGHPLTCVDIASASSAADLRAIGACGP